MDGPGPGSAGDPASAGSAGEAVAAGLLLRADQVLLVHRTPGRRWCPSTWDAPGGHLLPGEDAAAALVRELAEELGVLVPAPRRSPDLERTWPDWSLRLWVCPRWTGEPVNAAPQEHDALAWVTRAQVRAWATAGALAGPWVLAGAEAALAHP